MAEFLLLRPQDEPMVWIVEAKSSTPHPKNLSFDTFIREIQEKLTNALTLSVATCLKRHSTCGELPNSFQTLDLKKARFRLILVIKGHRKEWLPPLQDALKLALNPTIRTWSLSPTSVVVLNDEMARSQKLISSSADL